MQYIPAVTTKFGLKDGQQSIILSSEDDGAEYVCKILPSIHSPNERHLGQGWYEFVKDRKLKPGDLLKFALDRDAEYLSVQIVRC